MENIKEFTKENLWNYLVAKFAKLNDNDAKAKEVYDLIINSLNK